MVRPILLYEAKSLASQECPRSKDKGSGDKNVWMDVWAYYKSWSRIKLYNRRWEWPPWQTTWGKGHKDSSDLWRGVRMCWWGGVRG